MPATDAYRIDSRSYLLRGLRLLEQGGRENLFYAAFEFRCAAESRMQQYLEAWEHVPKSRKQDWEVGRLSKSLDRAFSENKLARVEIKAVTSSLGVVLYYTPCRQKLKDCVARLGKYLHAKLVVHPTSHDWWDEFRTILFDCRDELVFSNTGTLIGPFLRDPKTGLVRSNIEVLQGQNPDQALLEQIRGARIALHVSQPDTLPDPIEPNAVVWRYTTRTI